MFSDKIAIGKINVKMSKPSDTKIFLVDDDKDMCESLADVLSLDSGYKVSYSTDPLEALETIKKENFSLIIIDYKMPKMNGIELLKNIKQVKPDLTIFMLTAFISTELIAQATKEGANKVLSKFTWPNEILKCVKDAIK